MMTKPKTIVIDAYDSFSHLLAGYVEMAGCEVKVIRNDDPTLLNHITPEQCDLLVLGPGPGHPKDSRYFDLISHAQGKIPIFGVCLGHQAIAMYYGAQVSYAKRLMHGKTSLIHHDGLGCFSTLPSSQKTTLKVMRYHSIVVDEHNLTSDLVITARSEQDNYIMGLRHKTQAVESVQFHPESVGTEHAQYLMQGFMTSYLKSQISNLKSKP
jgi:anthranilate synthase/aminodeoxychorismate synthase-like glutamine amidotransferase